MPVSVGCVHLLYGLAGSGKTTRARDLSEDGRAVRYTLDEWMLRLYPDVQFDADDYGPRAEAVKELVWSVAEQVLLAGTDVVLDWNSWSRARRAWATERARTVGAEVVLHWLGASLTESSARAERRNAAGVGYVHHITHADNEHLATLMEPPDETEGLRILRDGADLN